MSDQTTDIVQRLRSPSGTTSSVLVKEQREEAADEIERLRSALEAIADGEGEAQEIARQTLARETADD